MYLTDTVIISPVNQHAIVIKNYFLKSLSEDTPIDASLVGESSDNGLLGLHESKFTVGVPVKSGAETIFLHFTSSDHSSAIPSNEATVSVSNTENEGQQSSDEEDVDDIKSNFVESKSLISDSVSLRDDEVGGGNSDDNTETSRDDVNSDPIQAEDNSQFLAADNVSIEVGSANRDLIEVGHGEAGMSNATVAIDKGSSGDFDIDFLLANGWVSQNGGNQYIKNSSYGHVSLDMSSGQVTYVLNDNLSDTQALTENDQITERFTVRISSSSSSEDAEVVFTGAIKIT